MLPSEEDAAAKATRANCWEAAGRPDRTSPPDPSRSRDRGGSGLGLAIASKIVEGHGGRLELETRPERGCVFRCVLPGRH